MAADSNEVPINYFVCTLGQAAQLNANHPHNFSTINELLEEQARTNPKAPAVGFALPYGLKAEDRTQSYKVFNFRDLLHGSRVIAHELSTTVLPPPLTSAVEDGHFQKSPSSVAVLCASSADYLFLWLGLTQLGFATLHVAPQSQPAAIAHLCQICNISNLFYDEQHKELAKEASKIHNGDSSQSQLRIYARPFPFESSILDVVDSQKEILSEMHTYWPVNSNDIESIGHTSGTSSGMPKPIPGTHHQAVGVLPSVPNSQESATFTTTPLYHGGVADIFRAWTSGALIWLFNGRDLPVTTANVRRSLEVAEQACQSEQTISVSSVKYFSSVPYVLQLLSQDETSLEILRRMDIVGVGGAALPSSVGDELVKKGVKLASRFGSAECGFLLSSHRDYSKDHEWQYLRAHHGSELLRFEAQEDGKYELVVQPGWPRMTKTNRPDGSFATADLFVLHESIPNAWRYHSRADSQLTLNTGKKFDPAPLEAALAALPLISDVLIFGNGRPYPGAILFPSEGSSETARSRLLDQIWPEIEALNSRSPPHSRLARHMVFVESVGNVQLEKSSKGTVLRNQAEQRYEHLINAAYEDIGPQDDAERDTNQDSVAVPNNRVLQCITEIIASVTTTKNALDKDADLFSQGADSIASMQIRGFVQRQLLPSSSEPLPINVVYDCGTIEKLAHYIVSRRSGKNEDLEDEEQLMIDLVEEYGNFKQQAVQSCHGKPKAFDRGLASEGIIVVLTGATGTLGAQLLDLLRSKDGVSQIICLVRAKDFGAARERVNKSLVQRGKAALLPSDNKVHCVVARLGEPSLGLSADVYQRIANQASIYIHAAWAVNFSMRLRSFVKDHISGVHNLLRLAISSRREGPPKFVFCSSTASVVGQAPTSPIPESVSLNPACASSLGYSRSKWVAESICARAHQATPLHGRISIVRIGQLCGDTKGGVWNVTEAWPLMLSTVNVLGALPHLDEPLSWLPVDIAAKAVEQIATTMSQQQDSNTDSETPVYHVVNNDKTVTWLDLLQWMKKLQRRPFEIIPARDWVSRLENLTGEGATHPARKLLGLWKSTYALDEADGESKTRHDILFEMTRTQEVAPILRNVGPINEEQFQLIFRWMEQNMESNPGMAK